MVLAERKKAMLALIIVFQKQDKFFMFSSLRHGLAVRIAGSHPAGPGSTPGVGILTF